MSGHETEKREGVDEASSDDPRDGENVKRSDPHANARPGTHDSALHPDTPETMQDDHEGVTGRQRYADARPGDYGRDFQADESGSHPVKPASADAVDEDGIPNIAETEPPERRSDG